VQSDVNSHHRASLGVRLTRSLARLAIPTRAKFPGDGFLGLATVALVGSVVVAFLSINQSSQVASTGFDIRELDNTRTRLEREEQRLASEGAQLRAFGRIETEAATRLGMVPAPSPEYVRARRSPLDIDARLREAEARARSQQPTLDDRLSRWLHLSVVATPVHSPVTTEEGTATVATFPTLRRAWSALTSFSEYSPPAPNPPRSDSPSPVATGEGLGRGPSLGRGLLWSGQ
jgi:hypothetical protein